MDGHCFLIGSKELHVDIGGGDGGMVYVNDMLFSRECLLEWQLYLSYVQNTAVE